MPLDVLLPASDVNLRIKSTYVRAGCLNVSPDQVSYDSSARLPEEAARWAWMQP